MAARFAGQARVDVGTRGPCSIENPGRNRPVSFLTLNAHVAASMAGVSRGCQSQRPEAPPISIIVNWRALLNR